MRGIGPSAFGGLGQAAGTGHPPAQVAAGAGLTAPVDDLIAGDDALELLEGYADDIPAVEDRGDDAQRGGEGFELADAFLGRGTRLTRVAQEARVLAHDGHLGRDGGRRS